MNQPVPEARTILRLEVQADKVAGIYAVCINCNKRFTSIRSVSMHLKVTANRHVLCFYNHGNYDKKTGLGPTTMPTITFRSRRSNYVQIVMQLKGAENRRH